MHRTDVTLSAYCPYTIPASCPPPPLPLTNDDAATHSPKCPRPHHPRRPHDLLRRRAQNTPHDHTPSRRGGTQGNSTWQRLHLGGTLRELRDYGARHGAVVSFLLRTLLPSRAATHMPDMSRRTDGISWSASRIAQEFLFYRQRDSDAEPIHTSVQWAKAMK